MSPAPLFRCTSIAAPITALLRRSAFSYNGCIRDTLTEGNEGNKRRIRSRNSSLSSLSSVYFSPSASPTSEASNFHRRQQSNRVGVGFATFRYLRFFLFTFFLLAALLRIGWMIKRESRGSHRVLSRPGWPDVVFGFQ